MKSFFARAPVRRPRRHGVRSSIVASSMRAASSAVSMTKNRRFSVRGARPRIGKCGPHHGPHFGLDLPRDRLAVGAADKFERLAEMHFHVDAAFAEQGRQMRHELLVADPGRDGRCRRPIGMPWSLV